MPNSQRQSTTCVVYFNLCVFVYGWVCADTLTWRGGAHSNRFAASAIALGSVSPY